MPKIQRSLFYSRIVICFILCVFILLPGASLWALTLEKAMDQAAEYFVQDAVKIPYGQKLYISKIVNLNSQEQDRQGKNIESELYFAIERQSPDYKLQLGETTGKAGDVYITGTYSPAGEDVEVQLRVIQQDSPPLILAQHSVTYKLETARSRLLVAVMDLEASMLDDSPKKAFSEIFRASLSQKNAFNIVNSADIDKLDPVSIQQSSGCTRDECATIIGEQLGVDRVISTSLFEVSSRVYVLSGKIINILDGSIVKSRTVKHTGDLSNLDIAIEELAVKLTEGNTAARETVAVENPADEIRAIIAQSIKESQADNRWAWDDTVEEPAVTQQPIMAVKKEDSKTSTDLRKDAFLFVGATPYALYNPSVDVMPYSVGLYLGSSLLIGYENFSKEYAKDTATAKAGGQSVFIRFFSGNSYNMKIAMHERSIESTATVSGSTVTQKDIQEFISFGIGNQWITDAGVTLGGDWIFYAKATGNHQVTTTSNGGSSETTATTAINTLKSDIDVQDFGLVLVTFTIGFSF